MRKFRFIGDASTYRWKKAPVYGKIYDFDSFKESYGPDGDIDIFNELGDYNELEDSYEWEEVFDEPKQLHKDTDLGYFTQFFISLNPTKTNTCDIDFAIAQAKYLIKQLYAKSK